MGWLLGLFNKSTPNTDKSPEFQEGYRAFQNDIPLLNNAYRLSNKELAEDWKAGWNYASDYFGKRIPEECEGHARGPKPSPPSKFYQLLEKGLIGFQKMFWSAFSATGVIIAVAGILLFGLQVLNWLEKGFWTPFSLYSLLPDSKYLPRDFSGWLYSPQSWIGLHKLVVGFLLFIPFPLFLFVAGAIIAVFATSKTEALSAREQPKPHSN